MKTERLHGWYCCVERRSEIRICLDEFSALVLGDPALY